MTNTTYIATDLNRYFTAAFYVASLVNTLIPRLIVFTSTRLWPEEIEWQQLNEDKQEKSA